MKNKNLFCFCICLLFIQIHALSQFQNIKSKIELQAGYTTKDIVPFWIRSNQFGSVPNDNGSISLLGSSGKEYERGRKKIFDWGASFEGRLNTGYKTNFTLIEGYGKAKIGFIELKAGRTKEVMGLLDTLVSSGSWSVSGNVLGIPKAEISIPEYLIIPWFGRLFAFKGQFSHGWLGPVTMDRPYGVELEPDTFKNKTFFHQKSFYGRFGKPEWNFFLHAGFNHQVFWGNEDVYYGDLFTLSRLQTLKYVTLGKPYVNHDIPTSSKIGNHLGSIDIGIEFKINHTNFFMYRQNFYDVGNLYYLTNIADGLNGLSITNENKERKDFQLRKVVFEFLYTKSQAGQPGARETPTSWEHYYNNHQYIEGWSFNRIGLGTPFITTKFNLRDGLPVYPRNFFINNRVIAYHLGFSGNIYQWKFMAKTSFSQNYGTYFTTDEEQSTGIPNPGSVGVFGEQNQFSAYVNCSREIHSGYNLGFIGAFDVGDLLYNSIGLFVIVSKSF